MWHFWTAALTKQLIWICQQGLFHSLTSSLSPTQLSFQRCLFVFQQDCTKTTEPVPALAKLGGGVGPSSKKNPLTLWKHRNRGIQSFWMILWCMLSVSGGETHCWDSANLLVRYLGRHVIWRPETSKVQWSVRRACQGMVTAMLLTKPSSISRGAPRDSKSSLTAWSEEEATQKLKTNEKRDFRYVLSLQVKDCEGLRANINPTPGVICCICSDYLVWWAAVFPMKFSSSKKRELHLEHDVRDCCWTRVQLRNSHGCTSSTKTHDGCYSSPKLAAA